MSTRGWQVEQLTDPADLPAIAALERAAFGRSTPPEVLWHTLARSPASRLYVLRGSDREVAGFCACWVVADELHINDLVIAPDCRRRGLATALLRHVLVEAAAAGAVRATLEVRAANAPARALYERLGFTVRARRRRYYADPEDDALILWREPADAPAAPGNGSS